ncbi:MAG: hypothetical protein KBA46_00660 [Candidatus Omnitrophica bacterium]|nr:hypothetical protein [Candidatus Omnitrophota bacterium]
MQNKRVLVFLLISAMVIFAQKSQATEPAQGGKTSFDLIDQTIENVQTLAENATQQRVAPNIPQEPAVPATLIDLDFNEADLQDVLRIIGEADNQNIVLDPTLRGRKVTIHLKKVTTKEALDVLSQAYGLGSSANGNILFVSLEEKIKKGMTKVQVVPLRNLNSEEAKNYLKGVVSTVNSSTAENSLVLVGAPKEIDEAMSILNKVDVAQPQVLLEVKVLEIGNDALRQLGVDWPDDLDFSLQERQRPTTLAATAAKVGAVSPLQFFDLERSATSFAMTINMLETKARAKVLSRPRVTTMNNKEAQVFVGDKVPYTITTVTAGVAQTEVRWVEPGIRLNITPSIVDKDFVVIKVEPEVSYIYSWVGANDEYPWMKSREATAYVRVKNGQPFVIAGLLSNEDKKDIYGLPFLGKIPLLGNLFFGYDRKTDYNTELIITVVPTIITK